MEGYDEHNKVLSDSIKGAGVFFFCVGGGL